MLPNMYRPSRQQAVFCRRPLNSPESLLFRFCPEECFLKDVFIYLPDATTDTSQLSLAIIHGIEYYESSRLEQTRVDDLAVPINTLAFVNLLDSLATQLTRLIASSDEQMLQEFRASPTAYLDSISLAIGFLLSNRDEELYLVVEPYL